MGRGWENSHLDFAYWRPKVALPRNRSAGSTDALPATFLVDPIPNLPELTEHDRHGVCQYRVRGTSDNVRSVAHV